jgi:hypothetical protein
MTGTLDLSAIELKDPDVYLHGVPHESFRLLREHDPVHWHPETAPDPGFWAITKHADVKRVSHEWETFSSELGATFIPLTGLALPFARALDPARSARASRWRSSAAVGLGLLMGELLHELAEQPIQPAHELARIGDRAGFREAGLVVDQQREVGRSEIALRQFDAGLGSNQQQGFHSLIIGYFAYVKQRLNHVGRRRAIMCVENADQSLQVSVCENRRLRDDESLAA